MNNLEEKIKEILESDPVYTILGTGFQRALVDGSKPEIIGVTSFMFGDYTIDRLLEELEFSCKRCGGCCKIDAARMCPYLERKDDILSCKIHEKPNYPLICYSFPFVIGEIPEYMGARIEFMNGKVRYKLGIFENIGLIVEPDLPCFEGRGKKLKNIFIDVLKKLLEVNENSVIWGELLTKVDIVSFGFSTPEDILKLSEKDVEKKKEDVENWMRGIIREKRNRIKKKLEELETY